MTKREADYFVCGKEVCGVLGGCLSSALASLTLIVSFTPFLDEQNFFKNENILWQTLDYLKKSADNPLPQAIFTEEF